MQILFFICPSRDVWVECPLYVQWNLVPIDRPRRQEICLSMLLLRIVSRSISMSLTLLSVSVRRGAFAITSNVQFKSLSSTYRFVVCINFVFLIKDFHSFFLNNHDPHNQHKHVYIFHRTAIFGFRYMILSTSSQPKNPNDIDHKL